MGSVHSSSRSSASGRSHRDQARALELAQSRVAVEQQMRPDDSLVVDQFRALHQEIEELASQIGHSRDQIGESLRSVHKQALQLHAKIGKKLEGDVGSLMSGTSVQGFRQILDSIRQNYQAILVHSSSSVGDMDFSPMDRYDSYGLY